MKIVVIIISSILSVKYDTTVTTFGTLNLTATVMTVI